jgi:CDP-2,3-bis-(O-geranylgeranyl)-sn-glycerol synthase
LNEGMFQAHDVLQVLWLFVPAYVANMSPVLVQGHLERLAAPMDGGRTLDGRRILGDHKTWRGLLAGIVAGAVVYELQRLVHARGGAASLALIDYATAPVLPGLLMGLGAGVGDAVKSFFKRRADIPPGASWPVFDQLDFFFGSYAFLALVYVAPLAPTLACLPAVLAGSIAVTAIGWALGLKEAWI